MQCCHQFIPTGKNEEGEWYGSDAAFCSYPCRDPGITSGVETIFSAARAPAALKTDGSVITWGSIPGPDVSFDSFTAGGITAIRSAYWHNTFVELQTDNTVILRSYNMTEVATMFSNPGFPFVALYSVEPTLTNGVVTVFLLSRDEDNVALKSDGSVKVWRIPNSGTLNDPGITSGAETIFSSYGALAALIDSRHCVLAAYACDPPCSLGQNCYTPFTRPYPNREKKEKHEEGVGRK
jgi:hypothetical protein